MAWYYPLIYEPQGAFLHMYIVFPLSQKGGRGRSLNPLPKRDFAPLCPCHDYYLKLFTKDKDWLLTVSVVTFISEGK